jgi:hypothetical protein
VKGRCKVELGLARGKKAPDKREAIRERTDRREVDRAMASARSAATSRRLAAWCEISAVSDRAAAAPR